MHRYLTVKAQKHPRRGACEAGTAGAILLDAEVVNTWTLHLTTRKELRT